MTSTSKAMWYASAALRGVVISPPGRKLVIADLSNIEGRLLAWFAGEEWKLEAFRAYDAGTGPDLYNITAVTIIGGDPWKVPKPLRNAFGKVPDLASGYQGGVAGYQQFAKAYNVRLADHWDTIQLQIAAYIIDKAWANLREWGGPSREQLEISEIEWVASEACKLAWRNRHPKTKAFWYGLQNAAKEALAPGNLGKVYTVGEFVRLSCVQFRDNKWLLVKLPSGRYITYFRPKLINGAITYEGEAAEDGKTQRIWTRIWTHGGKMTGNVCQTTARDILAPALDLAETEGYLPVLSVHDEAVCETPDTTEFSSAGLSRILSTNPAWAPGLPLAAAGMETHRYHKED